MKHLKRERSEIGRQSPVDTSLSTGSTTSWDINPEYAFEKELGNGTYGTVCQAYCHHTNKHVAIKKFTNIFDNPQLCKRMLRETELLCLLDHPNIVKAKGILLRPGASDLYLIEDLAETDLRRILHAPICLTPRQIKFIMYRIIVALNYLHSGGVVHRDIKPGNILIDSDGTVKVCDFSLSRSLAGLQSSQYDCALALRRDSICFGMEPTESDYFERVAGKISDRKATLLKKNKEVAPTFQRELSGHVASRWYRPPELILVEKIYTTAVDIWATGCIFGELLELDQNRPKSVKGGRPLFPGDSCFPLSPKLKPDFYAAEMPVSAQDQLKKILELKGAPAKHETDFITDRKAKEYVKALGNKKKVPLRKVFTWADEEAVDLLEKMLMFNPYERITAKEALQHSYFADVRDKSAEIEFGEPVELVTDQKDDTDISTLVQDVIAEITEKGEEEMTHAQRNVYSYVCKIYCSIFIIQLICQCSLKDMYKFR
eukprot:TRINITY_DN88080_c0_g1_i1.p1 TRINITY_DN88080_c0_g1~~TRINITY_DN88080_c0_g1_i1.p1  ORF type:complete len:487 (-),score=38.92 TRINITY_DN88080_c0_g1_i1:7-1467(-)